MTERIRYAAAHWDLENPTPVCRHSGKTVLSAESLRFGPVVLKIDDNPSRLQAEYHMLRTLDGSGCCKVYGFCKDRGILLEERILPGTPLRDEPSLEKRIQAFSHVFRRIHRQVSGEETYLQWLDGICHSCIRIPEAAPYLDMALQARSFCAEVFNAYPDRVLLHGDLHHDNLLRGSDGSYVMIDPKGIVGPAILDTPRFILNELDAPHDSSDLPHILKVIRLLEKTVNYPEGDLKKLFYMETVLANVWNLEDGKAACSPQLALAQQILRT